MPSTPDMRRSSGSTAIPVEKGAPRRTARPRPKLRERRRWQSCHCKLVKPAEPRRKRMIEKHDPGQRLRIDDADRFQADLKRVGAVLENHCFHGPDPGPPSCRPPVPATTVSSMSRSFKNLVEVLEVRPTRALSRLDAVALHDLQRQVDGGARERRRRSSVGAPYCAGKHVDLAARIVVQRDRHLAELVGVVDLRRDHCGPCRRHRRCPPTRTVALVSFSRCSAAPASKLTVTELNIGPACGEVVPTVSSTATRPAAASAIGLAAAGSAGPAAGAAGAPVGLR